MSYEQKRTKVIELVDDCYGDNGMTVLNLMTDYMAGDDWADLYNRLERDGAFETED